MAQNKIRAIYFVTSADLPIFPGRGGTEAFVISFVRNLHRRGVESGIVTVGLTEKDGRGQLPNIPFIDIADATSLQTIDATLVTVCRPQIADTQHPAFLMMHVPPVSCAYPISEYAQAAKTQHLIANSHFNAIKWGQRLHKNPDDFSVVYPFADPAFAAVKRPKYTGSETRVLFAGRLSVGKGIYLLLESLHHQALQSGFRFTVTTAGSQSDEGKIIYQLLKHHPLIDLVDARTNPTDMAELFANQDIVVMPSNNQFWQEAFGMISVEAQHAGCRVVATNAAGLPETDCGSLSLFKSGNSLALANAIKKAADAGPVPDSQRRATTSHFTLDQSVDSLLSAIDAANNRR